MITLRDDTTTDSNQCSSSHNHIDSLHNKSITFLPNQLQAKQHQKSGAHSNNSLSRYPFIDSISTQIPDNYRSNRENEDISSQLLNIKKKRSGYRHPNNYDYFDFIAVRSEGLTIEIKIRISSFTVHVSTWIARKSRISPKTTQKTSLPDKEARLLSQQTSTFSRSTSLLGQSKCKNLLEDNSD
ncbi:hypothetical protein TIFTF001_037809 [Ficus carica]|uniref:Uncharacterized protein n=1 Tax=Ficus carica TaxID=3494 RepID=A0AA88E9F6_FICCA|nr:hypothetical protein TIFTF001_037809 [Ficus carica]